MFYCVSEIENLGNVTAVKLGNVFSVATNKSTKAIVHSSKVQKAKCRGPKKTTKTLVMPNAERQSKMAYTKRQTQNAHNIEEKLQKIEH